MLALYRPPRRRARRTAGSPETPAQERHGVAVAKVAVAALGSGLPAQTPPHLRRVRDRRRPENRRRRRELAGNETTNAPPDIVRGGQVAKEILTANLAR
jgi:hypothetical protein